MVSLSLLSLSISLSISLPLLHSLTLNFIECHGYPRSAAYAQSSPYLQAQIHAAALNYPQSQLPINPNYNQQLQQQQQQQIHMQPQLQQQQQQRGLQPQQQQAAGIYRATSPAAAGGSSPNLAPRNQVNPSSTNNRSPSPNSMQGVQNQSSTASSSSSSSSANPQGDKGSDYVYFERSTAGMSKNTLDAATGAKLKLEHFYKVAVEQAIERSNR